MADYKKVFLREFKKALDEKEEEERGGLHIKILGPGCPYSQDFVELALTALSELGLPADVQHITDMQDIAQWGVTGTPALIINDKVKAIGRMPNNAMDMGLWTCSAPFRRPSSRPSARLFCCCLIEAWGL